MGQKKWDDGLVVYAAGNGPAPGTVLHMGIQPKVTTVGCSDDREVGVMGRMVMIIQKRSYQCLCVQARSVAPGCGSAAVAERVRYFIKS